MLNQTDFAEQLRLCSDAKLSVDAFEDWFEESSWNVHQSGDEELTNAVFRVESWLSAYNEGRLSQTLLQRRFEELANSMRPFVPVRRSWILEKSEALLLPRSANQSLGIF